jgi:hypothetical protein
MQNVEGCAGDRHRASCKGDGPDGWRLSAQIASSGALRSGRHAGSLANAGITGERFPGLRIERCCPAQTVVLLELTEGPLRLGTQDAIKRPFVEPLIAKFDLRPANVVFPEGVANRSL